MPVDIKVPPMGESVSEATIAKWFKKVGDAVKADEALCELETDKVTVEVPAPVAGQLVSISVEAGGTVGVGAKLGEILEGAAGKAAAPAPAAAAAPKAAAPAPAPAAAAQPGPAARKALSEAGMDAAAVAGSGKDGRVTKADVAAAAAAPKAAAPAPAAPAAPRELGPREERVKMTRLRLRIAERLKQAQNTAAMLTTFNEIDMTAAMALRTKYNETFEKRHGVKLGFMSIFAKACVVALKELPAVNAEIDGQDIVYKNHYDIGIAVGTPQGLVVPVVRDCDALGFADIEKKIGDFGRRARDGKLTMDEMTGGTFTITNGGIYGSLMSTPILNPPQSGILGMHKIQPRPMAIGDKIEIRPMMYVALSYDHRIIDGREAVTFLVRVKECVEDPGRLILDM
ncbi:MAG: 2-oxoglutarate dehydrogenase complex dihydrolipoyllysine-residue succinyltransferase [Azospirillum sp.]|nr:2-oxoglutarate dehydrogenase complex dihydrolipoyllysine-residue succinyltransferase [Azospirillum sp.]MCA3267045.1 2-oxoglutarate dehydrogenase complex dihydrolipoyllysine-residue succinyltransferase [Azospirillum sp.]MCZ8124433.1 2-oxoglutarate dehydrogenase complex dihydrolipoyllysine-residue succinyltransferase [Magnetospirillum sp.]